MLLKFFYDTALAHASYLVGCQKTGEAIVIDPSREIGEYLNVAKHEKMKLVGAVETHIHADFVSGARELAERTGAKLYLSDEGTADWKYTYTSGYDAALLKDREEFLVGKIRIAAMHTPGHTPEHMSFLLTDEGGGASRPMGLFSGDFVFVGSIGRPDLLETAAGIVGSAEQGARDLFHSLKKFKKLPDYLQLWPAHGAGSACGKGLGAIPSSTVGYEKLFNPALQYDNEQDFVEYILADQPETPRYFKVMKRVNKVGPVVLGPDPFPKRLPASDLSKKLFDGRVVIDTRLSSSFAGGHPAGTINVPVSSLATWAGWFVNYEQPIFLVTDEQHLKEAARVLHEIGIDQIGGWFDAAEIESAGLNQATYLEQSSEQLVGRIQSGQVQLIDVRATTEWNEGHIPEATHMFLGKLRETASDLDPAKPVVVQCRSGARSAIGASVLMAAGFKDVINLTGGFTAWQSAKLPVEESRTAAV